MAKKRKTRAAGERYENDDDDELRDTLSGEGLPDDEHDADEAVHVRVTFSALDEPGPVMVPEVLAGDVLLWLAASDGHIGNVGNPAFFEAVVSADGEVQQLMALPGHTFDAIFLRGV